MAFRPGFLEVQSMADPLLTFNWQLVFPNVPGSNVSRELTYKAVSTSLPGSQVEQVSLEAHSIKLNYAGRRTWQGTWSLTLFESRTSPTRGALFNWMELCRNWDTNSGLYKSEYSVTVELQLLDAKNNIMRSVQLLNAWPMSIDDVSLDQTSSVVQYQCQFSFDRTLEIDGSFA